MLNNVPEQPSDWRKHWLVANVLAEIPILGSFFKHKTLVARLHGAAKCSAALTASAISMHLVADDMSIEQGFKSTGCMALTMMTSNVAFNTGTLLFQYLRIRQCSAATNQAVNEGETLRLNAERPINSIV